MTTAVTEVPFGPARPGVSAHLVDSTLVVRLNRPDRANALDEALMEELTNLWAEAADSAEIRAVVLTGNGRAFCAGADVSMLSVPRTRIGLTAAEELSFLPGPHLEVPVIAAVNGVCAGGGLHFVADADIVIASEAARFIDPHVSVGQVSGIEPVELLLRMRRDAVIRMALLGRDEVLDANQAQAAGLVSEVVAPDGLLPRVLELAGIIASASPEAIRHTRAIIRSFEDALVRRHLDLAWDAVRDHWTHPDSKEGPKAFLERRNPRWIEP